MTLSAAQLQQFKIDGYLVLPKLLSSSDCETLIDITNKHLAARQEPFELEASVKYPGAPTSPDELGGQTIRRLLLADRRDPAFLNIAKNTQITDGIKAILRKEMLRLNPNHHNCVMTKLPEFSSETLWHRDTRYWHFSDKYLVNAWCALDDELAANGAMKVLPGSHRWQVRDSALDEEQFLILDHPFNQDRLATARTIELKQGDVLLFSAHCFHAAGKNTTSKAKYSLVFTYHDDTTKAIKNTRSDLLPPIDVQA